MTAIRSSTPRPKDVAISKLLLDQSNARLGALQPDQRSTEIELAKLLGNQLFELANDIVDFGMDPSFLLIIVPDELVPGKFRMLEGNRRLLVVRALTRPKILADVLTPARYKRLLKLSERFKENPVRSFRCIAFEAEEDADHWIELRHTGENGGAGLVGWDSNEQARWRSRRGGLAKRTPAGQVIDFVDKFYPPEPGDIKRIISTLQRVVVAGPVKSRLGIEIIKGIVYTHYPAEEALKGLSKVVLDLRSGRIKVTDVYHAPQRGDYINRFASRDLPDPAKRFDKPVILADLVVGEVGSQDASENEDDSAAPGVGDASGGAASNKSTEVTSDAGKNATAAGPADPPGGTDPATSKGASKSRVKLKRDRPSVIPASCALWIPQARINILYHELSRLNVDDFANACAVSLRVFVELSVDYYIAINQLMSEVQQNNTPLAKKLKELAKYLRANGAIGLQVERAVTKIADGVGMFSASTITFNQYVHNEYVFPLPSELRLAWDELEPFMSALWKK
ncbi:hypothetical protein ACFOY4_22515 [Actinomadura syzygii]|uniref:ParB/Sulfiredoxin domain-containing protein n=1 Tax=Actinomadura syzygii TaxID=1427538 RepID=A0A5D0UMF7_9ACTN|nr:hypothetical protein [Actinomadura syzygii]TYC18763.1 hypothetical protein FXF65_03205 [Actinomadura syzygii]